MSAWLWRIFLIWYSVGVVLVAFDLVPPALEWANAVFLYLAGLIGAVYLVKRFGMRKGILLSLFIIIWSIAVESFGAKTGLIFGEYHYEKDFGVHLLGVPITIGFAWLMVITTGLALISPQSKQKSPGYPLLASLLAVAMDLVIDPVAFHLKQYWIWEEGGLFMEIPTQNFIGWFFTALSIHLVLYPFIGRETNAEPIHEKRAQILYGLMILMFAITSFVGGIGLAAVLSILLAAVTLSGARYV